MACFILRACFGCGLLSIVLNIAGIPRVHDHFNPAQEHWREVLCTLEDGYFATWGALEECHFQNYPGSWAHIILKVTPPPPR